MVFEVMGAAESPRLVDPSQAADENLTPSGSGVATAVADPVPAAAPAEPAEPAEPAAERCARSLPDGVVKQLLRSAVTLQAEGLLRTTGALAGVWGTVLDRTEWIERDARDLADLVCAAWTAKVPLPAGVDAGAGDPESPTTVVEGMLAAQEALANVLRQLVRAGGDPDSRPWLPLVDQILRRREEEILLLRAVGAAGRLPSEEQYVHGCPPRY
jgi:hypothetical protein